MQRFTTFVATPSDLTDLDRDARSHCCVGTERGYESSHGKRETLVCRAVPLEIIHRLVQAAYL